MSIGKRILDLARANLNALLDKAGGDVNVDDLTDEELEAELERRRERRRREAEERTAREAAEKAAREKFGREPSSSSSSMPRSSSAPPRSSSVPPRSSSVPPRSSSAPPRSSSAPPPRSSARVPRVHERRARELYAQLEVPYGADFEEVKRAFRKLMRKYHPDMHANDPVKHRAATQLAASLTQAYNELEVILVGGPNRAH